MNVKIPEPPKDIMPELPTVTIEQVEKALNSIRNHFTGINDSELRLTFEYLVGSFYPTVYQNMCEGTKLAWQKGYMAGIKDGIDSKE